VPSPPRPPFVDDDWDDALGLEDLPEAQFVANESIHLTDRWLAANGRLRVLALPICLGFHRTMFGGLFPQFAGKLRGHGEGQINTEVSYGGTYGVRAADVPAECAQLFEVVASNIARLDEMQRTWPPDEFAEQVRTMAAYTHCELVRIHPFVNGNGRTSRKCIDYFAWRYGFLPPRFPPKADASGRAEYLRVCNSYERLATYLAASWEPDPVRGQAAE
jgi:fido (protein-threonine AMPylation protein)